MNVAEYLQIVRTVHARTTDWRLGQTYFNVLTEARPELAEKVRGSIVDPFHQDARIGDFLVFVSDNWDEVAA
ncbi:hypothetical protein [Aeromicrobium sp.]|uniref:hypothetical protein n=1 Tax=Aeromicrobium sp. TaxID=1871063 RepID=UPI002FC6D1E6